MTNNTKHGYLVLADISGYTSYLTQVELEHANEILSDLLEAVVKTFKSSLTISKLEGDAVFAYAPETAVPQGECMLELIESTYFAFRGRQQAVRHRTTCECRACRNIPNLDLKFFVHHGDYMLQHVAGIVELLGSDVNLVHRLMKNHVAEKTGWHAYALFTAVALEHIRFKPDELYEQVENYEHLGDVPTYSYDLHPHYQRLLDARHAFVTPEEAHVSLTVEYPLSPAQVWDWMNDPAKIVSWSPQRHMVPAKRILGRVAAGAQNHCVHGKSLTMIETIQDWRPFDYFTVEQVSIGLPMDFVVTTSLATSQTGTRATINIRMKPRLPIPAAIERTVGKFCIKIFQMEQNYHDLGKLIATQLATNLAHEATRQPE